MYCTAHGQALLLLLLLAFKWGEAELPHLSSRTDIANKENSQL